MNRFALALLTLALLPMISFCKAKTVADTATTGTQNLSCNYASEGLCTKIVQTGPLAAVPTCGEGQTEISSCSLSACSGSCTYTVTAGSISQVQTLYYYSATFDATTAAAACTAVGVTYADAVFSATCE